MSAIKDFLESDTQPVDELSAEELRTIVSGYRALVNMIPLEVTEWLIRIGEPFRILTRKYEPKTGVLANVKFEPVEFALSVMEPAFDPIRGQRLMESKTIILGDDSVLYFEDVEWSQPFEDWVSENQLGEQSLDVGV